MYENDLDKESGKSDQERFNILSTSRITQDSRRNVIDRNYKMMVYCSRVSSWTYRYAAWIFDVMGLEVVFRFSLFCCFVCASDEWAFISLIIVDLGVCKENQVVNNGDTSSTFKGTVRTLMGA